MRSPPLALALFCLLQFIVWTLMPALVHSSPPIDVVEGYIWGRERLVATIKHPMLPSWVLEASRLLTGTTGWPAYVASQLFVCTAFVATYALGRELLGAHQGLAAALLTSGTLATSWLSPNFNHDIAQLPLWPAFAWMLWRAVASNGTGWWLGAAICAALVLYTKITGALLLAAGAAWLLADPVARSRLATLPPWLALAAWIALLVPLVASLISADGAALDYAATRARGRTASTIPVFLLRASGLMIGAWLLLGFALWSGSLWPDAEPGPTGQLAAAVDHTRARRFLALFGAGPLLILLVVAAVGGLGLKSTWIVPTAMLSTLLVVHHLGERLSRPVAGRVAAGAFVLLPLVAAAYAVNALHPWIGSRPSRVNWPQAEIARRLVAAWHEETGGADLKIVAGDAWIAGLVALGHSPMPTTLIRGNFQAAPWITPDRLAREGALVVWDFHDFHRAQAGPVPPPPAGYRTLPVGPARAIALKWPRSSRPPDLIIGYAIIAPKAAGGTTGGQPTR